MSRRLSLNGYSLGRKQKQHQIVANGDMMRILAVLLTLGMITLTGCNYQEPIKKSLEIYKEEDKRQQEQSREAEKRRQEQIKKEQEKAREEEKRRQERLREEEKKGN